MLFHVYQLEIEINLDRRKHAKKLLKPAKKSEAKPKKQSTTDPDSGWFHKGEHKEVFAYNAQVACDKHGWALAYTVEAGNIHDSQAFSALFVKLEPFSPEFIIADSGYKTPSIAKFLLEKGITPVFPYTRPRGKKDFLRPKDFVYDEHFDCYLCPENHVLTYRTTTREGYREYKSNPKICKTCPLLAICTESRQHQKVVVRHIWKDALEVCEDIRHQSGMKERYQHRKETIERLFGTAKEYHNLRYTREKGKSKMEDKVGLTLACLNIKKLVKMMTGKTYNFTPISQYYWIIGELGKNIKKTNIKNDVCLHSEQSLKALSDLTILCLLGRLHTIVHSLSLHQLFMGSVFNDIPIIHDQNKIRIFDGRQSMGNDETSSTFH